MLKKAHRARFASGPFPIEDSPADHIRLADLICEQCSKIPGNTHAVLKEMRIFNGPKQKSLHAIIKHTNRT